MNEVWKNCPLEETNKEVSSQGRVRYKKDYHPRTWKGADRDTRILNTHRKTSRGGSVVVSVNGRRSTVAWLIATAFIPNPTGAKKPFHINGDITDNRVENLSWIPNFRRNQKPKRIYKPCSDKERLMRVWGAMKTRCNNPKHWDYSYYGGRGIKVSKEWDSFAPFYEWAMTSGYSKELQLDRIDNELGYSPTNCRWVTRVENGRNKRNNHFYEIDGKQYTIADIAHMLGVGWHCVYHRIKSGWNPSEVLSKWGYRGDKNCVSGEAKINTINKEK